MTLTKNRGGGGYGPRPWSRACRKESLAAGVEQREKRQQPRHGNENPQDSVWRPHKLHRDVLRPGRQPQDHLAAGLWMLRCCHLPVHFHAPRRIIQQPQRHAHRLLRRYLQLPFFRVPSQHVYLRPWCCSSRFVSRKNHNPRRFFRQISVVVVQRIVFIRAFKALVIRYGFPQIRNFVRIPPRLLHQERTCCPGNDNHCRAQDPPGPPPRHRGREKTGIRHRQDGHPSPRKLHKTQLEQVFPKSRTRPNQHENRRRRKKQQYAPQFSCFLRLFVFGGASVRRDARDPCHHHQHDRHTRSDPIEQVVLRIVGHRIEKIVRRMQSRRERLRDVHPSLFISRGE